MNIFSKKKLMAIGALFSLIATCNLSACDGCARSQAIEQVIATMQQKQHSLPNSFDFWIQNMVFDKPQSEAVIRLAREALADENLSSIKHNGLAKLFMDDTSTPHFGIENPPVEKVMAVAANAAKIFPRCDRDHQDATLIHFVYRLFINHFDSYKQIEAFASEFDEHKVRLFRPFMNLWSRYEDGDRDGTVLKAVVDAYQQQGDIEQMTRDIDFLMTFPVVNALITSSLQPSYELRIVDYGDGVCHDQRKVGQHAAKLISSYLGAKIEVRSEIIRSLNALYEDKTSFLQRLTGLFVNPIKDIFEMLAGAESNCTDPVDFLNWLNTHRDVVFNLKKNLPQADATTYANLVKYRVNELHSKTADEREAWLVEANAKISRKT